MSSWDDYLRSSIDVLTDMASTVNPPLIEKAIVIMTTALMNDKPLLVCGNGGSAADSLHIAGELVGRFMRERRALKVMSLAADVAVLTAWSNDYTYDDVFARQTHAFGEPGGVLLAISTSGNSSNVVAAVSAAKSKGMHTIALTGKGGGQIGQRVDVLLDVPSTSVPLIQQAHICLYHYICGEIEARIASLDKQ